MLHYANTSFTCSMAVPAQVRSTDVRKEIIRFLTQECVIGSSVGSTTFNDDSIGKWPKRRGVRGSSDLSKCWWKSLLATAIVTR